MGKGRLRRLHKSEEQEMMTERGEWGGVGCGFGCGGSWLSTELREEQLSTFQHPREFLHRRACGNPHRKRGCSEKGSLELLG